MRDIIAKFDQMPPGDEVPVTVWSSEGSRTLRNRAVIKMPSFTDAGLTRDSVLYPNGTCRPEPDCGRHRLSEATRRADSAAASDRLIVPHEE